MDDRVSADFECDHASSDDGDFFLPPPPPRENTTRDFFLIFIGDGNVELMHILERRPKVCSRNAVL